MMIIIRKFVLHFFLKNTVMEIKDNAFLRQFEAIIDKQLISLEYSLQERKIFLTKLNAPEGITDDEVALFFESILNKLQDQKIKVVPTTPKVVSFFKRHTAYREMLPPGIVI